jgi:acyl-CoA thioesterase I
MKLSRLLWLGALGCSANLVACQSAASADADAKPKPATAAATAPAPAIVFLGDSLTAGLGLPESQALPSLIQGEVDRAGLAYQVINGGRSGDTTAGGLARLDWYLRDSVDLRVVVIGLGSNDAIRGLSLQAMEDNLRAIITRIRAHRADARILLWELKTFPNMGADYGAGFNATFKRIASSENVELIPFPLEDTAGQPSFNQADGVHPNAAGAERVAARVWRSLKPQL